MLVIRLRRTGKKKKPSFRVIVAEKTMPIYGRFVDIIGNVNLQAQPKVINIDKDKALDWIKKGAKPSDTVARLLVKVGALKEEDIVRKPDKKRSKKKEQPSEEKLDKVPVPAGGEVGASTENAEEKPAELEKGEKEESKEGEDQKVDEEVKTEKEDQKGEIEEKKKP